HGRRCRRRRRGRSARAPLDPARQCAPLRALDDHCRPRGRFRLGAAHCRRRRPRHRCRGSRAGIRTLLQSGRRAVHIRNGARRAVPGTVQAAAVLMAITGGVHLALIPDHLDSEPFTSALFLLNGVAFITLAASFTWRWWRLSSSALLIATVLGYLIYVGIGLE